MIYVTLKQLLSEIARFAFLQCPGAAPRDFPKTIQAITDRLLEAPTFNESKEKYQTVAFSNWRDAEHFLQTYLMTVPEFKAWNLRASEIEAGITDAEDQRRAQFNVVSAYDAPTWDNPNDFIDLGALIRNVALACDREQQRTDAVPVPGTQESTDLPVMQEFTMFPEHMPIDQLALNTVSLELQRQRLALGFTAEHDDEHTMDELRRAAICHLLHPDEQKMICTNGTGTGTLLQKFWPFNEVPRFDARLNKLTRFVQLVRGTTLMIAELARLHRQDLTLIESRRRQQQRPEGDGTLQDTYRP